MTIATRGLSTIKLPVADLDRALAFYAQLFGVREYFRDVGMLRALGPGPHDALVFEERSRAPAAPARFGFKLARAEDMDEAIAAIERAGGSIVERGETMPDEPFVTFRDPDGNVVQLWYDAATA